MKKLNPKSYPPATFFLLTFLLSLPFYILNILAYHHVLGQPEMGPIYIAFFTVTPITAAAILTFRRHGSQGLKALISRIFDCRKIKKYRWYFVIVLLQPLLFLLSLLSLALLGFQTPTTLTPLMALPLAIPFLFLLAAGEEVGWMGYAFDSMEKRYGGIRAALVLGVIWAFWHTPFFFYLFPDPIVHISQFLTLIVSRVLLVWVFCNTGRSVFGAILFHASGNLAIMIFPEIQAATPWGSAVYFTLLLSTAFIVTFFWGTHNFKRTETS